jgi:hypothetical protein
MAYTYKVTLVVGKMDNSICPPPFLNVIFPAFNGEPVIATESDCIVTFATPQTPADLGPLVRVELLTNDNP